jgi:hypothetical protein
VVEEDERDPRLLQNAAIVLWRGADPLGTWAAHALRENPGALLCAAVEAEAATATMRDGRRIVALAPDDAPLPFDAALLPSAIYACEISGRFVARLPVKLTIRSGSQIARVRLDGERVDR